MCLRWARANFVVVAWMESVATEMHRSSMEKRYFLLNWSESFKTELGCSSVMLKIPKHFFRRQLIDKTMHWSPIWGIARSRVMEHISLEKKFVGTRLSWRFWMEWSLLITVSRWSRRKTRWRSHKMEQKMWSIIKRDYSQHFEMVCRKAELL